MTYFIFYLKIFLEWNLQVLFLPTCFFGRNLHVFFFTSQSFETEFIIFGQNLHVLF